MRSSPTEESTNKSREKWRSLSAKIAKADVAKNQTQGELQIFGSGISYADLSKLAISSVLNADVVFHCLHERLTQIWLDAARPDAFDLRVLYAEGRPRYHTYVCMAEAMLHEVRSGKKVAALFYGHPGFFATPAHRALKIALKEGYLAKMQPGISALDHMVADLGFDPMSPGLGSFDGSYLSNNWGILDPRNHNVIWQIGMVGNHDFSAQGFSNTGLGGLVKKLISIYGPEAPVKNYIASIYPGLLSQIDEIGLNEVTYEYASRRIDHLSSLYLPPAISLNGQDTKDNSEMFIPRYDDRFSSQFDISLYGKDEREAINSFENFSVDPSYRSAGSSIVSDYLLNLYADMHTLRTYNMDPASALAGVPGLTDRSKRLLSMGHYRAINAAIAEANL